MMGEAERLLASSLFLYREANERRMRLCGAGILPFFVDDQQEVHFLLAKERFVPHWRGSSRWSGFEGGNKASEDVYDNAVREFVEESVGVITGPSGTNDIRSRLQDGDYAMRINVVTENSASTDSTRRAHEDCMHVTFVVQWPYDETIVDRFTSLRKELVALHNLGEIMQSLAKQVPNVYPFYRTGEHVEIWHVTYVVASVDHVKLVDTHLTIELTLRSRTPPPTHTIRKKINYRVVAPVLHFAQAYEQYIRCCHNATKGLAQVYPRTPPNAIGYTMSEFGTVTSVSVQHDYLEKACVKLWQIDDLKRLVSDSSTSDIFRPYFLHVLRSVLEAFTEKSGS